MAQCAVVTVVAKEPAKRAKDEGLVPSAEIAAMQLLVDVLEPLDADERSRVLMWAADRFDADATCSLCHD